MPSLAEIGYQLCLPLFQDSDLRFQPFQLAVDASQLSLGPQALQVMAAVLLPDQRFHLATQEPQPRVAVHRSHAVVELAGPDRLDDLVLCQPELLARRLVAERRALALPLGTQIVHRLSFLPARYTSHG